MKVTLESTTKVVALNGVPARIWEGVTDKGVECHAYVIRIACKPGPDESEFQKDLQSCRMPTNPDVEAIPLRLVL